MSEKVENYFLKLSGVFLLALGLFSMVYVVYDGRPQEIIWFCYISLVFIGWGFIFNKNYLILSQLNILFLPVLIWNIDFWHLMFTNSTLWGITDYFFFEGRKLIPNLISLQHVYVIPLALAGLHFIKVDKKYLNKSMIFSFVEVLIIFIISIFFTSREKNINCAFESCLNYAPGFIPYWLAWLIFMGMMIVISNWIFRVFNREK